ncbi:CHAT domain-containing protein [Chitinophaga rhizophila]|uniref:CHAT domain-containing protein n=1 Tax=Chitinophaga rhizophila TaxID=2866212 RepID=A0ABS7G5K2_9BACT|nr:CHAT domain-containing protein [Chitinophaga rhizophila]MBW8682931.1 CHAT domain-containing protein [Chitinophaga rhizophila]
MARIALLAYANDMKEEPLHYVEQEIKEVNLYFGNIKNHLNPDILISATKEDLFRYFADHGPDIEILHFSGHGNSMALFFTKDGVFRKEGLAELMTFAPHLKLVFLNACASREIVEVLHTPEPAQPQKGVPIVIGTHRPVYDKVASEFSIYFYTALTKSWPIGKAFDFAKTFVLSGEHFALFPKGTNRYVGLKRAAVMDDDEDEADDNGIFPWGLYYKTGITDEWSVTQYLHDKYEDNIKYAPNDDLIRALAYNASRLYSTLAKEKDQLIAALYDKADLGRKELDIEMENINDRFNRRNLQLKEINDLYAAYIRDPQGLSDIADKLINTFPLPLGKLLQRMYSFSKENLRTEDDYAEFLELQLNFYEILVKLAAATILSDLLEVYGLKEKYNRKVVLNPIQKEIILSYFRQTKDTEQDFDYTSFIEVISQVLKENLKDETEIDAFVKEYLHFERINTYENNFFNSHMVIKGIKAKIPSLNTTAAYIHHCKLIEQGLINLLKELFFILQYKMVVIKNVEAIRKRNVLAKTYFHRYMLLEQRISDRMEVMELQSLPEYAESYSVILVKEIYRMFEYLSLSPFLIDRNVLCEYDGVDLYFYNYTEGNGIVYKSLTSNERLMHILPETQEIDLGAATISKTTLPFIEEMGSKTDREKNRITNRLLQLHAEFGYYRSKIAATPATVESTTPINSQP